MQREYMREWLSGALVRRALEETVLWFGEFLALDVKLAGVESFTQADKKIHLACSILKEMLDQSKIHCQLYRIGGDEFVVIADRNGMEKIKSSVIPFIRQYFHCGIGNKQRNMTWAEAFEMAMTSGRIKGS